jgi:serine/threonine protein kinase
MGCASSHHKVLNHSDFQNIMPDQVGMSPLNVDAHSATLPTKLRSHAGFHDQFVIIDKLGKGAFARVYSSVRKTDGIEYAVKVTDLRAPVREDQNGAVRELCPRTQMLCESEVNILKQIGQQENCISMIDSYQEEFLSYIVMEKCEMTLLQGIERSTDVNETLYAKIFRDMLSALSSIHALNIVHLDVKPDNFLCQGTPRTGVVKLCDFGLAKSTKNSTRKYNRDVHGTAPFMAPEMLLKMGYDEKSDVWSFAVIAYVLFFGCFPYQPADRSAKGMKAAIAQGYPAPDFLPRASLLTMGSLQPHLSLMAEEFCRQMLNRDPMFRPSSKKALQHRFLSRATTEDLPSLRPTLNAAKMIGAFTPAMSRKEKETPDSVDNILYDMQARRGPAGCMKLFDSSQFGTATTAASSGTHHSSVLQDGTLSSFKQADPSVSHDSINMTKALRGLDDDAMKIRQLQIHAKTAKGSSRSADELPVITQLKKTRNHGRETVHVSPDRRVTVMTMHEGSKSSAVRADGFTSLPGKLHNQAAPEGPLRQRVCVGQDDMLNEDGLRADSALERAMELTLQKTMKLRLQTLANQSQGPPIHHQMEKDPREGHGRKMTPPAATLKIKKAIRNCKMSKVGLVTEGSNESTESSQA